MTGGSAPNIVALLLNQLQPYLMAPINEAVLVEDMLRVSFQSSDELNLLYWVKILPPVYYHTILNLISVEAFKQWYDRLCSYQEEYQALTQEQQNEWELALFYFRDKFRSVFDKESFRDILERKEEGLDMLGWRLKREPPLPLDVLAKLACLNYSEVRKHVETRIPDLKERLAFLETAEINVNDKHFHNPRPLIEQYNCWFNFLSKMADSKAPKKQSQKEPLPVTVLECSLFATEKTSLIDSQSERLEGTEPDAVAEEIKAQPCCLIS